MRKLEAKRLSNLPRGTLIANRSRWEPITPLFMVFSEAHLKNTQISALIIAKFDFNTKKPNKAKIYTQKYNFKGN